MNCKLFVANLPLHYGQPELVGLFMQFGRIIESRILMDANTGLSRCKAFVQFDNRTEAANALALNGTTLDGGKRPLFVNFAENHTKRVPSINPGSGPQVLVPMGGSVGCGGPQTLQPIVADGGGGGVRIDRSYVTRVDGENLFRTAGMNGMPMPMNGGVSMGGMGMSMGGMAPGGVMNGGMLSPMGGPMGGPMMGGMMGNGGMMNGGSMMPGGVMNNGMGMRPMMNGMGGNLGGLAYGHYHQQLGSQQQLQQPSLNPQSQHYNAMYWQQQQRPAQPPTDPRTQQGRNTPPLPSGTERQWSAATAYAQHAQTTARDDYDPMAAASNAGAQALPATVNEQQVSTRAHARAHSSQCAND